MTYKTLMIVGTFGLMMTASAISLHEAKSSGKVCEDGTGYVRAVDGSPEVQSLVDNTNAARRQKYAEIASRNGTSPDQVAAEAAASLGSTCN